MADRLHGRETPFGAPSTTGLAADLVEALCRLRAECREAVAQRRERPARQSSRSGGWPENDSTTAIGW